MARKQKDDIGQPTKARSIPLAAPESLPKAFQFKREAKQREQRTAEQHSASCYQQKIRILRLFHHFDLRRLPGAVKVGLLWPIRAEKQRERAGGVGQSCAGIRGPGS
jgi:hypothetical protein